MSDNQRRKICFSELFSKEVINTSTGERLGFVCDGEIDIECGEIRSLSVPVPCKNIFVREKEVKSFLYSDIVKIGDDTILIKNANNCPVKKREKRKNSCKNF